jgi:hypothetical protein
MHDHLLFLTMCATSRYTSNLGYTDRQPGELVQGESRSALAIIETIIAQRLWGAMEYTFATFSKSEAESLVSPFVIPSTQSLGGYLSFDIAKCDLRSYEVPIWNLKQEVPLRYLYKYLFMFQPMG